MQLRLLIVLHRAAVDWRGGRVCGWGFASGGCCASGGRVTFRFIVAEVAKSHLIIEGWVSEEAAAYCIIITSAAAAETNTTTNIAAPS